MPSAVVFGYFNGSNFGDNWIQDCWTTILEGFDVSFRIHDELPGRKVLERADLVVIGGGGLVFDEVGIWKDPDTWLQATRCPLLVAGLGVNRLTPSLEANIQKIIRHSTQFWVRDHESRRLLNNGPAVKVGPDLTWIVPKPVSVEKPETVLLSVAPCPWKDLSVARWRATLGRTGAVGLPLHLAQNKDERFLSDLGINETIHEIDSAFARAEIVVAFRYHAILKAVQSQIPFIAVNYDVKIERQIKEWNLDPLLVEPAEPEKLMEKLDYVRTNRRRIQLELAAVARKERSRAAELLTNIAPVISAARDNSRGRRRDRLLKIAKWFR